MKPTPITPMLLGLLAACGGGGNGERNPPKLWLASDVVETRVKLVDVEPDPF